MDAEKVALILGVLLAISEGLALIPALKANSVLQLVVNVLKALAGIIVKPKAE